MPATPSPQPPHAEALAPAETQSQGRAASLRSATHATHEGLDQAIMLARPFDSVENYGRFLRVQHGFHRDVAPLYEAAELQEIFPGLRELSRLKAVEADAADLGVELDQDPAAPAAAGLPLPEALGWLYVIEGSNLGAAFLLKAAKKMGLDETHGARHLAEGQTGRAAAWRIFKEGLDAPQLSAEEEARAVAGACTAFERVRTLVGLHMGA